MDNLSNTFLELFENIERPIPLHEPFFDETEAKSVLDCIETGWVSTAGQYVGELEERIKQYIKCKYCVVVNSGTSALHLSLIVAGVKPGDEVLCPTVTFVATANSIAYIGAIPNFIDCETNHPNICIDKLSKYIKNNFFIKDKKIYNKVTNNRLSAILPMHTFGMPVDMLKLHQLFDGYDISIIEDAAEAFGSELDGEKIGYNSKLATFSFNGNKIITTGAGGAVVTSSEDLYRALKHKSTTAKVSHSYEFIHDEVGYNYRMPNINAAIGVSQIKKINEILYAKYKIFKYYEDYFKDSEHFDILKPLKNSISNNWLVTGMLSTSSKRKLEIILKELNEHGIFVRPLWRPMDQLKMFRGSPSDDLSNSRNLYSRLVCLPSSPTINF